MDAIIRSGLSRFTDEVGRLWCKLADYYIRLGQFERARDVYEEAINSVVRRGEGEQDTNDASFCLYLFIMLVRAASLLL